MKKPISKSPPSSDNCSPCDGILSNIEPTPLRQVYAAAIKYIIPRKYWNYNGPIELRKSIKGASFEHHPNIEPMAFEFIHRDEQKMLESNAGNRCLRWLVNYNKGLHKGNCDKRIRKKRLNQLMKDFKRRLDKNSDKNTRQSQGVTLFGYSVMDQFILKGKKTLNK